MTDNLFWIHRDRIYEKGLDLGFKVFGPGHLIWLGAIAAAAWIVGRIYVKMSENGRSNLRKGIGLSVVLLEAAKIIVMGLFGVNNIEFLPLHLCSVGGLATLVYAMWPGRLSLDQLFGYAFFPTALSAILFPSATMYPWWNFYCIHIFVFHAIIIIYFVMLFMADQFRPRYSGLWLSFAFVGIFSIPVYRLNGIFHVNYMFIGMRSDVGILASLWDNIAVPRGRFVFTCVMAAIYLAVIHVFHVIYLIVAKVKQKHLQKEHL